MPQIGATELILILALALIIFGPGKLPDLGKAVGKTIREFRRSSAEMMAETESNPVRDKIAEAQITETAKVNS
jgi:sec-independent protein translocase protein TatA